MAKRVSLKLAGTPDDQQVAQTTPALAMGFRPFFLAASSFGCLAGLTWVYVLSAGLLVSTRLPATLWHAHEMLFGLILAVVAGFLLTAARNWTGRDTAHGGTLLGLVGLWLFARLSMWADLFGPTLSAIANVGFPVALLLVVGRVIVGARSKRNYGVLLILAALSAAAALVQLEMLGITHETARPALYATLHLLVTLTVVIAGRIIPLFTRNRTDVQTRSIPWLDGASTGGAAAVGVSAVVWNVNGSPMTAVICGVLALVSGLLQFARMRTWGTRAGLRAPMLAILHVSYAWLGIGHLLLAAAALGNWLSPTLALHALTIGGLGGMTVGMMSRVSQGHTGREIRAGRLAILAFVAINAAAVARLAAAVLPTHLVATTWVTSGSLFAGAYLSLLILVLPWLIAPRPDGRPG